jgi:NADPH:quinone reductase-like Zn-dependent oxidoreductase
MKAAFIRSFGPPEVLEVGDLEDVQPRSSSESLVQVAYASVNPVDTKTRQGNHRFILGKKFPRVLGYDISGTVMKSSDNSSFRPGDRVCGRVDNKDGGAYASLARCGNEVLVKVPENVDLGSAAAVPLAGCTALQALRDKGNLRPGNKVLINGASGGVGHLAVQIAHIMGAEVHAVGSQRNHQFLHELGAIKLLDYKQENWKKGLEKYDVIFDVAGTMSFPEMRRHIRMEGSFVEILPRPKLIWWKFFSLFDSRKVSTLLMKSNAEDLQLLLNWMAEGRLRLVIEHEFPLEEVVQAHKQMETGHTRGKIVLKIEDS